MWLINVLLIALIFINNAAEVLPSDMSVYIGTGRLNGNVTGSYVYTTGVSDDVTNLGGSQNKKINHCDENDTYSSLTSCLMDCKRKGNESGLNNVTVSPKMAEVTHKIMVFESEKYTDSGDGLLYTALGSFNKTSYIIINETAIVCYPLSAAFIECNKWFINSYEYDIQSNFEVWVRSYKMMYRPDEYYLNTKDDTMAICIPEDTSDIYKLREYQLAGYLISAASLVIAFVSSLIAKGMKQRSNRPLQCHMVMLFCGYSIVSIKFVVNKEGMESVCVVLACFQQFCFLSAFFWINSQAIDLHIALKDLRPNCSALKRRQRRFVIYCLYSWGIPAAITCLTAIAETMGNGSDLDPRLRWHCWFHIGNQLSAFLFFYGWMAMILVANIVLFLLIVRKFHQMGQEVFIANKNIHKQLLRISIKLVIVMGFFWVIKVVIWGIGKIGVIASVLDMFTTLQGFFIFLVYVCRMETVKHCLRLTKTSSDTPVLSDRSVRTSVLPQFVLFASRLEADKTKEGILSSPIQMKIVVANDYIK